MTTRLVLALIGPVAVGFSLSMAVLAGVAMRHPTTPRRIDRAYTRLGVAGCALIVAFIAGLLDWWSPW